LVEIEHYVTPAGVDHFQKWLDGLKDIQGRIAIQRRVDRVLRDNFGDHKFCQDGVWELRIDLGPGYRIYYAQAEKAVVLLLCGGSKRSQTTDIATAVRYWEDYQRRKP
jgi:putative addiction module killer protein